MTENARAYVEAEHSDGTPYTVEEMRELDSIEVVDDLLLCDVGGDEE